jgi:2-keto-4-pentenoate hydratase/2-oxohepta-3-ene-1,7-dioic acid hydratase in catechol pathway
MKLLRWGEAGQERPGLLDRDGILRDLSGLVGDIAGDVLLPEGLDRLRALDAAKLPAVAGRPRLGPPVGQVPNFIAVGLNYADHAKEAGVEVPREPLLFPKHTSCICGPNDPIVIPPGSTKLDWEVELGVVIGRPGRNIPKDAWQDHVAGYLAVNDVSERAFQLEGTGQWYKGKSNPTFGPLGPWLVTADEVPDPQNLKLWLEVDGRRFQNGSTATMVYGVAHLIPYISNFMALASGDIITTGTPPGVGLGHKPPIFLRAGQVVRLGVEGLGEQESKVVPA